MKGRSWYHPSRHPSFNASKTADWRSKEMGRLNLASLTTVLVMTACPAGELFAAPDQQKGRVMSGGMPIAGSTITLYRAGADTGSGAVALGNAPTNPGGFFDISYTPPSEPDAVLY